MMEWLKTFSVIFGILTAAFTLFFLVAWLAIWLEQVVGELAAGGVGLVALCAVGATVIRLTELP